MQLYPRFVKDYPLAVSREDKEEGAEEEADKERETAADKEEEVNREMVKAAKRKRPIK